MMCFRCGKCCIIRWKGKKKKCRYLIRVGSRTLCRIYTHKNRIGKVIGEIDGQTFKCIGRENSPNDYAGCPFNTNKEVIG